MRFSNQIRESISHGRAEAIRLGNNFIGIEHLILGLLHGTSDEPGILAKFGIDTTKVREEAEQHVRGKSLRKNLAPSQYASLPLSDQAERVILETVREAKARKSSIVEARDLIISIMKNNSSLDSLSPVKQASI